MKELLAEFDNWIERWKAIDEESIPYQVKRNLLDYARNVMLALCKKQPRVQERVDKFMGGVVDRYSPYEKELMRLADIRAEKIAEQKAEQMAEQMVSQKVDIVRKEKDAIIAKKDEEIARLKALLDNK